MVPFLLPDESIILNKKNTSLMFNVFLPKLFTLFYKSNTIIPLLGSLTFINKLSNNLEKLDLDPF